MEKGLKETNGKKNKKKNKKEERFPGFEVGLRTER